MGQRILHEKNRRTLFGVLKKKLQQKVKNYFKKKK